MSFMQPDIRYCLFFSVETGAGTEIVPASLFADEGATVRASALRDYCEGYPLQPHELLRAEAGWIARLSAPGYLDCTCWSGPFASDTAALAYLDDMYGLDVDQP